MKIRMNEEMLLLRGEVSGWMFWREGGGRDVKTDKQRTLQRMMMSKWKMFAIPRAKQRMMQRTPVLDGLYC